MQHARIVIVGAGLSGLYAAYLLEREGIRDIVLLEARDAIGGRIAAMHAPAASGAPAVGDRFDLGPTWFWPDHQRELDCLVNELRLQRFAQYDQGDMILERTHGEVPLRTRGYASAPQSMRLVGGMSALTDALYASLERARIVTGQAVRSMRNIGANIELESEDVDGSLTSWHATYVLLALPPRLVAGIAFEPALPASLTRQWNATATWMAPHAKYLAIYDEPFWREQGLSGSARSASGPLVEIHDASMQGGSAALFGFMGMPARMRRSLSDEILLTRCRAQMTRLFGPQAALPRAEIIKDWAQDGWTATVADLDAGGDHTGAPAAMANAGPWQGCLAGIASEWSPRFPGHVAGAIEAADLGVQALSLSSNRTMHSLFATDRSEI